MTPSLLDANVFIEAKNRYYRFAVCPGFWDWLAAANNAGQVFSIDKIETELNRISDDLSIWVKARSSSFFLTTDNSVNSALRTLSRWVSNQQYDDQAVKDFFASADYWLVAHALSRRWRVVTLEVSRPDSKKRVMIPDACNGVGVPWVNTFAMLEEFGARFVL